MPPNANNTRRRHEAFVAEYIKHFDAQKAYEDCGCYKAKGRAAQANASRLIANDSVISLINEAIAARNARTHVDQDRVVLELARVAFSDKRRISRWSDSEYMLFASDELDDDDAAAIAEITFETTIFEGENGTTTRIKKRIKTHDKLAALDKLARHTGLYAADNKRIIEFGVAEVPDDSDSEDGWREAVHGVMNGHATKPGAKAG